jgi:hypothetical protein
MTAVIQFIVLKRPDEWVLKSKDLERPFSRHREAVEKIWTYGESPYPPARSDLPIAMLGTAEPAKLADTLG